MLENTTLALPAYKISSCKEVGNDKNQLDGSTALILVWAVTEQLLQKGSGEYL
jgi:hypothetical protein